MEGKSSPSDIYDYFVNDGSFKHAKRAIATGMAVGSLVIAHKLRVYRPFYSRKSLMNALVPGFALSLGTTFVSYEVYRYKDSYKHEQIKQNMERRGLRYRGDGAVDNK